MNTGQPITTDNATIGISLAGFVRRSATEGSFSVRRLRSTFDDSKSEAFRASTNNEFLKLVHAFTRTRTRPSTGFPYTLPFILDGPERLHYAFPIKLE